MVGCVLYLSELRIRVGQFGNLLWRRVHVGVVRFVSKLNVGRSGAGCV